MMHGTYVISQHSAHWFLEKRIALAIFQNIDIGAAERTIKLGKTL
jgi:hypothetical protein